MTLASLSDRLTEIQGHISTATRFFTKPGQGVHDFTSREGKEQREALRKKVDELNQAILAIPAGQTDGVSVKDLRKIHDARKRLSGLETNIKSLDTEIDAKTRPPLWKRILFFLIGRSRGPQEAPVSLLFFQNLNSLESTQCKAFLDSQVDRSGSIEARVRELASTGRFAGIYAIGPAAGSSVTLYVGDKKYTVEPTEDGFKVGESLFLKFDELLRKFGARRSLTEIERNLATQAEGQLLSLSLKNRQLALNESEQALRLLGPKVGRYTAVDLGEPKKCSIHVEDGTGKIDHHTIQISNQGSFLVDGRVSIKTFEELKKHLKLSSRALSDVQKALPGMVAKNRQDLLLGLGPLIPAREEKQAHQRLTQLLQQTNERAIGACYLIETTPNSFSCTFVTPDKRLQDSTIQVEQDKIVHTIDQKRNQERKEYPSVAALQRDLHLKNYRRATAPAQAVPNQDVPNQDVSREELIAASKRALSDLLKAFPSMASSASNSSQTRRLLEQAVRGLGAGAEGSYLFAQENENVFVSFVKNGKVHTRLLDVETVPGKCRIVGLQKEEIVLVESMPTGQYAPAVLEGIKRQLFDALRAKELIVDEEKSLQEVSRRVHLAKTALLDAAGVTSNQNQDEIPTRFAELLGSSNIEMYTGAFVVYPSDRSGRLFLEVVTEKPNQRPAVEKFIVDVGGHPGEYLVLNAETSAPLGRSASIQELVQNMGLKIKLEKLEKDLEAQNVRSHGLQGSRDFEPTVLDTQGAHAYLSGHLEAVGSAGGVGAYLFRTNAQTTQGSAYQRGLLAQAGPGGISGGVRWLNDSADYMGSATQASNNRREPQPEYIVSILHKTENEGARLREFPVLLVAGSLQFEGKNYDSLPAVLQAIKAANSPEYSLADIRSISELKAMKRKINNCQAVLERDAGFSQRIGFFTQLLHFRTTYPPKISSPQEAEKVLKQIVLGNPTPTYVLYPMQEKTASGKPLFGLSVRDKNDTVQTYQIDIWQRPGYFTCGQEQSSSLATLIERVAGGASPYATQWAEYQRLQDEIVS